MFNNINGKWINEDKYILCSCDEIYFKHYYERFYTTFTEQWKLPIHVHVVDPSEHTKRLLASAMRSYTWCDTSQHNWTKEIEKFINKNPTHKNKDKDTIKQWIYGSYVQCQRFVLMGSRMKENSFVVVADIDAWAQNIPGRKEFETFFKQSSFSMYKGRVMATFGHIHSKNINEIKQVAQYIISHMENDHMEIGLDQTALAKYFGYFNLYDLGNSWIRHWDVKSSTDIEQHSKCYVYHEKGSRGKKHLKLGSG